MQYVRLGAFAKQIRVEKTAHCTVAKRSQLKSSCLYVLVKIISLVVW